MKKTLEEQLNHRAYNKSYTALRTEGYVLLAALLREPPSEKMKEILENLSWDNNLRRELCMALSRLRQCSTNLSLEEMGQEFHRLFVGLGSGELVPYASWYLEKTIQSAPLAEIRSDLNRFGLTRQAQTFESEDHVSALCEIMVLLSFAENRISENEQAQFFRRHMNTWMPAFFSDLAAAEKCTFYQAVGDFGGHFFKAERTYLESVSLVRSDQKEFDQHHPRTSPYLNL